MKPKLTVATTFPVYPPRGGGQTRALGLYGALAEIGVDVDIVCLVDRDELPASRELRPGLREVRVPKTPAHHDAERELEDELGGVPVTDVALALHQSLTPGYRAAVRESARTATAVVACHPYATRVLLDEAPGVPLIYEAQDVEIDIKAAILGRHDVLEIVRAHERLTCEQAAHVFTCADADAARLQELFGTPPERFATVANGYDDEAVAFTGPDERAALRRSVGLDCFTVLFVGSWHGPNLEAARAVVQSAREMPEVRFLIVGSAGVALAAEDPPVNVDLTGPVHEAFLHAVLALADVALNPMLSGSGTNLKMLEYAGAGLPLVSSEFGARGLGFVAGDHYLRGEPATLAAALGRLRSEQPSVTRRRVELAYGRVAAAFGWRAIAERWLARDAVQELIHLP